MNDVPADVRLRVTCCSCNRIAEVSLPIDHENLKRQLATQTSPHQYMQLARVARRSDERDKVALVEFLCGQCEEAEMRYPP